MHGRNHARDSGGDHGVSTRSGAALVRAWFEIDVKRSTPSFFSGLFESEDFRVFNTLVSVGASANDGSGFIHDDSTNAGIGRSQTDASPGQVEGLAEEEFVIVAIRHVRLVTTESQRHRDKRRSNYYVVCPACSCTEVHFLCVSVVREPMQKVNPQNLSR